jgi:hypothetical protein
VFRDGPEDSDEDEDSNDLGTAWIERPDGTEKTVNRGEWITRSESRRLAYEHRYQLEERG